MNKKEMQFTIFLIHAIADKYGIENMDYKYLVDDLIQNEPNLFKQKGNDLNENNTAKRSN